MDSAEGKKSVGARERRAGRKKSFRPDGLALEQRKSNWGGTATAGEGIQAPPKPQRSSTRQTIISPFPGDTATKRLCRYPILRPDPRKAASGSIPKTLQTRLANERMIHSRNATIFPLVGWFLLPNTNFLQIWLPEKSIRRKRWNAASVLTWIAPKTGRPKLLGLADPASFRSRIAAKKQLFTAIFANRI
jgi:hypothetical protein